jgi:uncharacterized protein (DUF362 family)
MGGINRREFIKNLSLATLGTALSPALLNVNVGKTFGVAPRSKVVISRHPEATADKGRKVNAEVVQNMMDTAAEHLTGQATVADAYSSLFPSLAGDHIIAVKVNTMQTWQFGDGCRRILNAIVKGLTSIGVSENNIIVYDKSNTDLVSCGYVLNTGGNGVRCFGSDENGWGFDDAVFKPGGQSIRLSKILTECDHLINLALIRDHGGTGASLSLKNHYGSVNCPSCLHGPDYRCDPYMAELNALEPIKEKTRLIVIAALVGVYQGHHMSPQFIYDGLIASQDPVAADYTGWQIIDEQRVTRGLRTLAETGRPPNSLETAAKLGLGANDPSNIELISIGEGKAVQPQDTLYATWGKIKREYNR